MTQQSARVAIEALRAGVPNRAAISLLGGAETAIEAEFGSGLGAVWRTDRRPGLVIAGGFGHGKSHLLNRLREEALARNAVVSWVTVSKETPLSQPGPVFAAAMRHTMLPGRPDDAVSFALAELQRRHGAVQDLELWASTPDAALAPVFAAIAHLLSRNLPPELVQGIEMFLCGSKPPTTRVRERLATMGARGMFDLKGVKAAALQAQRPRFMAQLLRLAGFSGWCILLDEVELIGRYGPMQRASAYAELARWLGLPPAAPVPGVHAAAVITDDFADEIINGRQDDERLPERLRLKGLDHQAELAAAAMAAIRAAPGLPAPGDADLVRHATTLQACYTAAYSWDAPFPKIAERRANRTMRHHIRGWITEWDMHRLQGGRVGLDVSDLRPDYSENTDMARPAAEDDAG